MVSRSRRLRVTVVFMVNTDSVLVSSFPSATVDDGYDGSYTRRMARSYGSKWDALRCHVRPGVKVLDFGCGMPENARLLRGLVEGAGGEYYCHDAHPDVEKAMRADGGFRHVSADRLGEYAGAFDVVFMSSVVHEMLTPACKPGNVANEALFELIGRLMAPSGCIVVRDWADYAAGAQDSSMPASIDLVDEGAAREVAQWVSAMESGGVIREGAVTVSRSSGGWVLAGERESVCEVFLHAVWGLVRLIASLGNATVARHLGRPVVSCPGFTWSVGSPSRACKCFMMRGLRVMARDCSVWVGCCRARQRL